MQRVLTLWKGPFIQVIRKFAGFSDGVVVKNLSANAGDTKVSGSIPVSRRSLDEGNGNPLQCCLENSMDRGAWQAVVHELTKFGHN